MDQHQPDIDYCLMVRHCMGDKHGLIVYLKGVPSITRLPNLNFLVNIILESKQYDPPSHPE